MKTPSQDWHPVKQILTLAVLSSLVNVALQAKCFGFESLNDAPSISSTQPEQKELPQILAEQFKVLYQGMSPSAKNGYRHLLESAYLPADFDQEVVDHLATTFRPFTPFQGLQPQQARSIDYLQKFGLSARPAVDSANQEVSGQTDKPLQYIVKDGQYVMNCFACHGGNLFGATYPGSPNTTYMLSALTEEVRKAKIKLGKKLTHMDVGSLAMPLGENIGTSNAVMFGVALMHYRDAELNVLSHKRPSSMRHHDMDAPPWWHFHRKSHLYIDGFAEKSHKGLMQFMLIRQNGPEKFREWESDFRDIFAFLEELRPPKYPYPLDHERLVRGNELFNRQCSSCHGTYGQSASYPNVRVPLEEIGTDPVRGTALTSQHRQKYAESWFADYGSQKTIVELDGYVAPPLDGVWASAPYFHNGSVPTLWHLMNPDQRPKIWKRTSLQPDLDRVGFQFEAIDSIPKGITSYERRLYFDTSRVGKSAEGHDFFDNLTEDEKLDLIEYLKSL